MNKTLSLMSLLVALSLLAWPVQAQDTTIGVGDTIEGELTTDDEKLSDDSSYNDVYLLEVQEGETYTITLTSEDFDPFLLLLDEDENILELNDDAEDLGLNSQIIFQAEESGTVLIYANSVFADDTGGYTLSVE